ASVPLAAVTPAAPLGTLLAPARLRVLLRTATLPRALQHKAMESRGSPATARPGAAAELVADTAFAEQLRISLKTQGAIVDVEVIGKAGNDQRRVADVVITLFERAVINMDRGFYYERQPDAINVLWILEAT